MMPLPHYEMTYYEMTASDDAKTRLLSGMLSIDMAYLATINIASSLMLAAMRGHQI